MGVIKMEENNIKQLIISGVLGDGFLGENGSVKYSCIHKEYMDFKRNLGSKMTEVKDVVNNGYKKGARIFKLEIDGLPINQDSLVVYITPNPRDMHKAGLKTAKELITMVSDGKTIYNAQSVALNQIQVTGVKFYYDVDVDFKKGLNCSYEELISWIKDNDIINIEAVEGNIIRTHGGFHIMVRLDEVSEKYKKSWYQSFTKIKNENFNVMMNGDNMIPMPGCVQSTFIPIKL